MKLEPKHITPYLPYGLKFCNTSLLKTLKKNNQKYNPPTLKVIDVNGSYWVGKEQDSRSLNDGVHKPILRPLSDITTPQILGMGYRNKITFKHDLKYNQMSWRNMNYLIEKHFDVFGLIENGLAININTLNKTS